MPHLLRRCVDFTSQQPSQDLALKGSRDGSIATVDLSAASDRMSVWVVECLFRANFSILDLLMRTRSDSIWDPLTRRHITDLRKFAPMGSAVTFPVQSILYALCALTAVAVTRGWDSYSTQRVARKLLDETDTVQVFGDDIALPSDCVPILVQLLEFLELKVNHDKTHVSGLFRESCGMDAWGGHDVTPAYVSHPAPTHLGKRLIAYVEQSNNAWRKGYWSLAQAMIDMVPASYRRDLPVAHESLGVASLFTFCSGTYSQKIRRNSKLMRWEVRGYSLASRPAKKSTLYQLRAELVEGTLRITRVKVNRGWVSHVRRGNATD